MISSIERSSTFCLSFPVFLFLFFFKIYIYLFLDRGEGREKERERSISVWLLLTHSLLGTWPATQTCVLTGNQTSDPLVCRPVLNPLSHSSQGLSFCFSVPWSSLSLALSFPLFPFFCLKNRVFILLETVDIILF